MSDFSFLWSSIFSRISKLNMAYLCIELYVFDNRNSDIQSEIWFCLQKNSLAGTFTLIREFLQTLWVSKRLSNDLIPRG